MTTISSDFSLVLILEKITFINISRKGGDIKVNIERPLTKIKMCLKNCIGAYQILKGIPRPLSITGFKEQD